MDFNISNLANVLFGINQTQTTISNKPQNNTDATQPKFEASPTDSEMLANMTSSQVTNLAKQAATSAANIMSNAQQNMFLRDMLDLPKDWNFLLKEFSFSDNEQISKLLKTLNNNNQSSLQSALLALAQANASVDLAAIAEHLRKSSALMADKLLKYMGAGNMSQNNISQLKSIMLIGASIANSANVNPQDFVRNMVQMYLPWLPLVPPNEENLNEIEDKIPPTDKTGAILFYLSTHNIGYFKVEILSDENIEIFITNITEIPNEELREDLSNIMKEKIKTVSQNAKLYFTNKIDNEELNIKEKQIYIVNSDDSMIGLSLLHLISKTIFEFDEKNANRFVQAENINSHQ